MRLIVVAAGTKLPDWVNAGFEDYAGRFTRDYKLELKKSRSASEQGPVLPLKLSPKKARRCSRPFPKVLTS